MQETYDYIIAGAGLAGLSLAYKIKSSPVLKNKSILLVDPEQKTKNDRTWCFWTKEEQVFNKIAFRSWDKLAFHSDGFSKEFKIEPYSYKMIRGIDFYRYALDFLQKQDAVDFHYEKIDAIKSGFSSHKSVHTSSKSFRTPLIFKSYHSKPDFGEAHFVWQHFKGWVIETDEACFDPDTPVFMDFRVAQGADTRFLYVLPFNAHEALVEIAIFSKSIPAPEFYDQFLGKYIKENVTRSEYNITETELGAIPMTTYNFNKNSSPGIIQIGTNGGSVKASTGYAFKRIQDETDVLVRHLEVGTIKNYRPQTNRYNFYDKILLNAILTNKTTGKKIFENIFKKLKVQTLFSFLDEDGSIINELKLFTGPPVLPFLKAFVEEFIKKVKN